MIVNLKKEYKGHVTKIEMNLGDMIVMNHESL
jgi:hypothetical protein